VVARDHEQQFIFEMRSQLQVRLGVRLDADGQIDAALPEHRLQLRRVPGFDKSRPRSSPLRIAVRRNRALGHDESCRREGCVQGSCAHRSTSRARRKLRHQKPQPRVEDFLPRYVKGAGLSMGDIHFSQGDGEIAFCGAIEMAG
jgi:Acetamidase/Formamidase family